MPNAPEGDTSNQGDSPKPLTLDDLKAFLAEELPKSVNAAVSNHTKRIQKDFDAKLAKLAPPAKPDEEGEETSADPKDAAKGGAPPKPETSQGAKPDPVAERLAKIEAEYGKKLAKLEGEAKAAREAAAAERRANIEAKGYAALRSALTGKVAQGAEDHALDLLRARGRVVIGDDGSVRMRGLTKDESDDGLDLESGVAAFVKSDEAKFFVPPPNAGPAGGKRSTSFGANGAPIATGGKPPSAVEAFEAKHGDITRHLL